MKVALVGDREIRINDNNIIIILFYYVHSGWINLLTIPVIGDVSCSKLNNTF